MAPLLAGLLIAAGASAVVAAVVEFVRWRDAGSDVPVADLPDAPDGHRIIVEAWARGQPYPLEVESVGGRFYLRPDAASAYRSMRSAAQAVGVRLRLRSAFRTNTQQVLMRVLRGDKIAAEPGKSPHQRAVSTDIDVGAGNALDAPGTNDAWRWLVVEGNALRFGFRPHWVSGAKHLEAWHFDYVG